VTPQSPGLSRACTESAAQFDFARIDYRVQHVRLQLRVEDRSFAADSVAEQNSTLLDPSADIRGFGVC
jgi:hypothetical protein